MKTTKFTKLSLAFAIICAITCCIAIAPLLVLIIFAIVAFTCLLICLCIYLFGAILWLLSGTTVDIFPIGTSVYDFATALFTYIKPIAKFSCLYITPYAGYVAIVMGILGIIVSSVALSKVRYEPKQAPKMPHQALSFPSDESISVSVNSTNSLSNNQSDGIFDPYSVYDADGKVVRQKNKKDKKQKKKRIKIKREKSFKRICLASLIVCIVFLIFAVAAVIFARFGKELFL